MIFLRWVCIPLEKSHQIFSGPKRDKIQGQTSEKFGDNLRFNRRKSSASKDYGTNDCIHMQLHCHDPSVLNVTVYSCPCYN